MVWSTSRSWEAPGRPGKACVLFFMYSLNIPFVSALYPVLNGVGILPLLKQLWALLTWGSQFSAGIRLITRWRLARVTATL